MAVSFADIPDELKRAAMILVASRKSVDQVRGALQNWHTWEDFPYPPNAKIVRVVKRIMREMYSKISWNEGNPACLVFGLMVTKSRDLNKIADLFLRCWDDVLSEGDKAEIEGMKDPFPPAVRELINGGCNGR